MAVSISGLGRQLGISPRSSWLFPSPVDGPREAVWTDLYFGGTPPAPVEIPYTWLSTPLIRRPDMPITVATISRTGGTTIRAVDAPSRQEYGENQLSVSLATESEADPAALASFTLHYYATQPGEVPRQRFAILALVLNNRTPTERWRILDAVEGTRIRITDAPASWPDGFTEQVIEGVRHIVGDQERRVEWMTSPVVGATPGEAGPWFRLGISALGGTDVVPY